MTQYHNFIGIDIGKFNFVTSLHGAKSTFEYGNSYLGITKFIDDHKDILSNSLCILEATGGYELELLYTLCQQSISVHRADTRKVKNFIRSFGSVAKTDSLDAKALSFYGKERSEFLELFKPQSKNSAELFHLVQRRSDLKQMLVAEKNRLQSPTSSVLATGIKIHIKFLQEQINDITNQIKKLIELTPHFKENHSILKTIPGIGDIVAFELLILLPELGQLTRRKIASLAGVAPVSNDSGKFQGYRRTGHGRTGVKPILFLAAMAARNSKSNLKAFYERLIEKGKKKMVALTALMRKILIIANAKLKNLSIIIKHDTVFTFAKIGL